jgi:hypothetical protein
VAEYSYGKANIRALPHCHPGVVAAFSPLELYNWTAVQVLYSWTDVQLYRTGISASTGSAQLLKIHFHSSGVGVGWDREACMCSPQ